MDCPKHNFICCCSLGCVIQGTVREELPENFQTSEYVQKTGFIDLIVAKKREAFLHTITEQFINIYKKQSNIETVKIKTATPISDVLKNDIIRFVKHNNKNIVDVETQEIIDPKIIGGVVIDMGGVRFDTSISKSINELRKKFNQNLYIKDY